MSKIILFPFVIIIAIYATIVFIVPTFKENSSLKVEIKNQEIRKEKLNADLTILNNFISDANNHKIEQGFLENFVPKDVKEDVLINNISRYASESGTTLVGLSFEPELKKKTELQNIEKIKSNISVTGTYENLYKFIERMFVINRLYTFVGGNIEAVQNTTESENSPSDQLKLDLSFEYFNIASGGTIKDVKKLGDVNYEKITKIKNKVNNVKDIEAQIQARQNPFAP